MSGLADAFFGLAGLISKPFSKKGAPVALPQINRDAADQQTTVADALAKRRGAAADMMNGTTGYEAGAKSTGRLVVGS